MPRTFDGRCSTKHKIRAEIRSVIEAWALETGQHGNLAVQALGGTPIGDDGVPVGQPKEGTATMLAIEVAKGGKTLVKSGGKGKGPKCASKVATSGAKKLTGGKKKAP